MYGELTTQVPCQEFQAPLSTAPLSAAIRKVTVFRVLTDPHFEI